MHLLKRLWRYLRREHFQPCFFCGLRCAPKDDTRATACTACLAIQQNAEKRLETANSERFNQRSW